MSLVVKVHVVNRTMAGQQLSEAVFTSALHMINPNELNQLYEKARSQHPDLFILPPETLDAYAREKWARFRHTLTQVMVSVGLVAPFAYTLVFASLKTTWSLAGEVAGKSDHFDFQTLFLTIPGLRPGSVCGVISILILFFLGPLALIALRKLGLSELLMGDSAPLAEMEFTSPRFVIPAVVCTWFAVGWGIVTAAAYEKLSPDAVNLGLLAWLIPLVLLLSFSPMGLAVLAFAVAVRKVSRRATTRVQVLDGLLRILARWPAADSVELKSGQFQIGIAGQLGQVAATIRRLYFTPAPHNAAEEWSARQFTLAADNLAVCASWLYVPQENTVDAVRNRVIAYANAFLSGRLDDLPRDEIGELQGLVSLRPKQRIMRTLLVTTSVLVYCLIPILAFFFFHSRVTTLGVPDSVWLLTYSLWIVVGFYGYLEQTSQNGVAVLTDLVKSVIGR